MVATASAAAAAVVVAATVVAVAAIVVAVATTAVAVVAIVVAVAAIAVVVAATVIAAAAAAVAVAASVATAAAVVAAVAVTVVETVVAVATTVVAVVAIVVSVAAIAVVVIVIAAVAIVTVIVTVACDTSSGWVEDDDVGLMPVDTDRRESTLISSFARIQRKQSTSSLPVLSALLSQRNSLASRTTRRPVHRPLSEDDMGLVDAWFDASNITLGNRASTPRQQEFAKRLLYTWRHVFVTELKRHQEDLGLVGGIRQQGIGGGDKMRTGGTRSKSGSPVRQ